MNEPTQSSTEDLAELLDEYVTAREAGGPVDLAPFEERAGKRAPDLRRQVALVQRIQQLSNYIENVDGSFGRFQKKGILGAGGSSTVFLATDPKLEREIALKVLSAPELGNDGNSVAEARSLARLDHPSVVKVFEAGDHEGQAYIAMERVTGVSLREALRALQSTDDASDDSVAARPASEAQSAASGLETTAARCLLVARIARALAYCHREGVVHRDIKPENILIDDALHPKMVDFGIARKESSNLVDVTGGLRGTPSYFAPEQVDQGRSGASPASDQFALGSVLYELLTLEHPFRSDSMSATMSAIEKATPLPLRKRNSSVPLDAELITLRCLEREPARRYSSMSALADDLEAFLDHRAVSVRPASLARQLALGLRLYRKQLRIVGLTALTMVLAWAAAVLWDQQRGWSSFASEIDGLQNGLKELDEAEEFCSLFDTVRAGWSTADSLDDSLLGWIRGPQAAEKLTALWSAAADQLDSAMLFEKPHIEPTENLAPSAAFLAHWERTQYKADDSRPPESKALIIPVRGAVVLPKGGILWRYDPGVPNFPMLNEVESPNGVLTGGLYRYMGERNGIPFETEFIVKDLEPRWEPTIRALDPDVALGMISVQGATFDSPMGEYNCDAFRITTRPVSWGEARAVFTDEEFKPMEFLHQEDPPDDDDPAVLIWVFAQEYAVRVGARLPTPVELWLAKQAGAVETSGALFQEWTSTTFYRQPDSRYTFPYAELASETFDHAKTDASDEEDMVPGTGFRLATSLPPRE